MKNTFYVRYSLPFALLFTVCINLSAFAGGIIPPPPWYPPGLAFPPEPGTSVFSFRFTTNEKLGFNKGGWTFDSVFVGREVDANSYSLTDFRWRLLDPRLPVNLNSAYNQDVLMAQINRINYDPQKKLYFLENRVHGLEDKVNPPANILSGNDFYLIEYTKDKQQVNFRDNIKVNMFSDYTIEKYVPEIDGYLLPKGVMVITGIYLMLFGRFKNSRAEPERT